ncbi:MAG: hypothetical protein ABJQ29_17035 [Luteolibacter sp.]
MKKKKIVFRVLWGILFLFALTFLTPFFTKTPRPAFLTLQRREMIAVREMIERYREIYGTLPKDRHEFEKVGEYGKLPQAFIYFPTPANVWGIDKTIVAGEIRSYGSFEVRLLLTVDGSIQKATRRLQ